MSEPAARRFKGEGWWEQDWHGRQPMHELQLAISGDRLSGKGWDMVGPFTLQGQVTGNLVTIIKQYLGRHRVEYYGTYDGEGLLAGQWRIPPFVGRWSIALTPERNGLDDEIAELK